MTSIGFLTTSDKSGPRMEALAALGQAAGKHATSPPCPVMAEIRKILASPGLTREARTLLIMAFRAQRTRTQP